MYRFIHGSILYYILYLPAFMIKVLLILRIMTLRIIASLLILQLKDFLLKSDAGREGGCP